MSAHTTSGCLSSLASTQSENYHLSSLILTMWNNTDTPLAYFISFRTYATWLHGDGRGSIDRFRNSYRAPYIPPNQRWHQYTEQQLKAQPLTLGARERYRVKSAIEETCRIRQWCLLACNVRTNHVHAVVIANRSAEQVLLAFKANATRQLREDGLWPHNFSPWARKGSKRKLWNEKSISSAVDYVLYGQGNELPEFDDEREALRSVE
jgi:REP element-mobilizing transposase RayT